MGLQAILEGINLPRDERTVVPVGDDAGAYEHNGVIYLHTVDFITPVVNDPYTWGQISAANSLSDIYAMGGVPLTALAVVGFNTCDLETEVLRRVLQGAADKLKEAKAVLIGGHTVDDKEPKFGLAVWGYCPEKLLTQKGAKEGELIVLTKPIGNGILVKALKEKKISESDEIMKKAIEYMTMLNDRASRLALSLDASSCTDVTGFGLLGHLWNICRSSNAGAVIYHERVPVLEGAKEFAEEGLYPRGAKDNLVFLSSVVETSIDYNDLIVLCDPVTSGGLLFTVSKEREEEIMKKAEELNVPVWIIGEITGEKVIKVL